MGEGGTQAHRWRAPFTGRRLSPTRAEMSTDSHARLSVTMCTGWHARHRAGNHPPQGRCGWVARVLVGGVVLVAAITYGVPFLGPLASVLLCTYTRSPAPSMAVRDRTREHHLLGLGLGGLMAASAVGPFHAAVLSGRHVILYLLAAHSSLWAGQSHRATGSGCGCHRSLPAWSGHGEGKSTSMALGRRRLARSVGPPSRLLASPAPLQLLTISS